MITGKNSAIKRGILFIAAAGIVTSTCISAQAGTVGIIAGIINLCFGGWAVYELYKTLSNNS